MKKLSIAAFLFCACALLWGHRLTRAPQTAAVTPTFNPRAGTYAGTQSVTISTTSPGAIICYNTTGSPSTNGSNGCTTGTLYSTAVSVSTNQTLYAVAGGTGYTDSSVGRAAYDIVSCNHFVSPTGADAAAGTIDAPWQTMQKAFDSATAGETVCFRGGIYPQTVIPTTANSFNQTANSSGTAANPITYTNYPGEIADIHGSTRVNGAYLIFRGTPQNPGSCSAANQCGLIFEGSQPIGGQGSAYVIGNISVCCEVSTAPHNIAFDHVEIKNGNYHFGIYVEGCDSSIIGSYVHDNGTTDRATDNGIYWSMQSPVCTAGHGGLIADNVVEHNYSKGIQTYDNSTLEPAYVTVTENTVVNNGNYGIAVSGENNVIANNIQYGNNAVNNPTGPNGALYTGTANLVDHNVVYNPNNPGATAWYISGGCCESNTTTGSDPLFVNALLLNWHLTGSGPAIDFTNATYVQTLDKDSVTRTAPYAAGAYQFTGILTAATPTFNPAAGTYVGTQSVTISTTTGPVICYNTTGTPVINGAACSVGTLYSTPVSVSVNQTLYAVAGGTNYTDSAVGSAAYVITTGATVSKLGGTAKVGGAASVHR